MRRLAALLLVAGAALTVWLRSPAPVASDSQHIAFTPLNTRDAAGNPLHAGPFRLLGAWHLTSPNTRFYGFSALVVPGPDRLLALSDRHTGAWFAMPGRGATAPMRIALTARSRLTRGTLGDIEAAMRDPASGTVWLAYESPNVIERHDRQLTVTGAASPAAMRHWRENRGAEAMTRLADGRFVAIGEEGPSFRSTYRPAVLFGGDPVVPETKAVAFRFIGPPGFSPTDMAQLPDGRVLVLTRRLTWPLPLRFSALLALADPAEIAAGKVWRAQGIARFGPELPVDNMEGMAIEPRADGTVRVWLISDSNRALTQRTVLWELALDPADLPQRRARTPARKN